MKDLFSAKKLQCNHYGISRCVCAPRIFAHELYQMSGVRPQLFTKEKISSITEHRKNTISDISADFL